MLILCTSLSRIIIVLIFQFCNLLLCSTSIDVICYCMISVFLCWFPSRPCCACAIDTFICWYRTADCWFCCTLILSNRSQCHATCDSNIGSEIISRYGRLSVISTWCILVILNSFSPSPNKSNRFLSSVKSGNLCGSRYKGKRISRFLLSCKDTRYRPIFVCCESLDGFCTDCSCKRFVSIIGFYTSKIRVCKRRFGFTSNLAIWSDCLVSITFCCCPRRPNFMTLLFSQCIISIICRSDSCHRRNPCYQLLGCLDLIIILSAYNLCTRCTSRLCSGYRCFCIIKCALHICCSSTRVAAHCWLKITKFSLKRAQSHFFNLCARLRTYGNNNGNRICSNIPAIQGNRYIMKSRCSLKTARSSHGPVRVVQSNRICFNCNCWFNAVLCSVASYCQCHSICATFKFCLIRSILRSKAYCWLSNIGSSLWSLDNNLNLLANHSLSDFECRCRTLWNKTTQIIAIRINKIPSIWNTLRNCCVICTGDFRSKRLSNLCCTLNCYTFHSNFFNFYSFRFYSFRCDNWLTSCIAAICFSSYCHFNIFTNIIATIIIWNCKCICTSITDRFPFCCIGTICIRPCPSQLIICNRSIILTFYCRCKCLSSLYISGKCNTIHQNIFYFWCFCWFFTW